MKRVALDCKNKRYGRATAIEDVGKDKNNNRLWLCKCDCGRIFTTTARRLNSGHTQSCGCLRDDTTSSHFRKHGLSETRLNRIWRNIKTRCCNPLNPEYSRYGGRGISICKLWYDDFMSFYDWSLNNGYSEEKTIDRIDNSKGYSPDNCRWTDYKTQSRNRRSNILITFNGERHPLIEWCEKYGSKYSTVYNRIRRGWGFEKALFTPIDSKKIAFMYRGAITWAN